jgi:hypothetical protein
MNKLLCNICCAFIVKKINRHNFRKKYLNKSLNKILQYKLLGIDFDTFIKKYNSLNNKVDLLMTKYYHNQPLTYLDFMPFKVAQQELTPLKYNYKPLKDIVIINDNPLNKNNNVRTYFVTFGDSRMAESANRIRQQAINMNYFNKIFICDENNLSPEFVEKMRKYLLYGTRGFGYWCWKSDIILQTLNEMQDGENIVYCDMGCHLINNGIALNKLEKYIKKINDENCVLCQQLEYEECMWTKADIFNYFNVLDNEEYTRSKQSAATYFLGKKNQNLINAIKEWRYILVNEYEKLVTDTPSKIPNFSNFRENRHDQSIFSLISKKYNFNQYCFGNKENEPIKARRDKKFTI